MSTHETREHLPIDAVPSTATDDLWQYVTEEVEFLTREDQRRVPQSVAAAILELARRARVG